MLHEHHPLAGKLISVRQIVPLNVGVAEDCARFTLQLDPANAALAAKAFGCALPDRIGQTATKDGKVAARLGPDEFYLLAPLVERDAIEQAFAALYAAIPHSLVDVGHREIGIVVEGASAELVLRSALAFDLELMSVGTASRTIFDKAQVILIREASDRFRIEVWRSFADHVWGILQAASREITLGI